MGFADAQPVLLLSSAPFMFSAPVAPAQPLRISRYVPTISAIDIIARSTSHDACSSFDCSAYLFADHELSLALRAFAATHQLHHAHRNDVICFQSPTSSRN
jgi:hypothetical protein